MLKDDIEESAFQQLLVEIDRDLAEQARARGCPTCGGSLHYANYLRRPRGVRGVSPLRFSLCCAAEGCRRRHTPGSVRFLGRRVYVGVLVVLLATLRYGVTDRRLEQLREQLAVSSRTLKRWRSWWQRDLVGSRLWKVVRGLLAEPVDTLRLPASLLERFTGQLRWRAIETLWLLRPSTTGRGLQAWSL